MSVDKFKCKYCGQVADFNKYHECRMAIIKQRVGYLFEAIQPLLDNSSFASSFPAEHEALERAFEQQEPSE